MSDTLANLLLLYFFVFCFTENKWSKLLLTRIEKNTNFLKMDTDFFVYSTNGTNAAMFPSSSTNSTSLKAAGAWQESNQSP